MSIFQAIYPQEEEKLWHKNLQTVYNSLGCTYDMRGCLGKDTETATGIRSQHFPLLQR